MDSKLRYTLNSEVGRLIFFKDDEFIGYDQILADLNEIAKLEAENAALRAMLGRVKAEITDYVSKYHVHQDSPLGIVVSLLSSTEKPLAVVDSIWDNHGIQSRRSLERGFGMTDEEPVTVVVLARGEGE